MKTETKNHLGLLQLGVLMQCGADDALKSKLSGKARQLIAATALAAVSMTAVAQERGPISPGNCARVGSGVGAALGSMAGKTWETRALAAALGAFAGDVAGHYACKERAPAIPESQPQTTPQTNYPQSGSQQPHSARMPYPPVQPPMQDAGYLNSSFTASAPAAQAAPVKTPAALANLTQETQQRLDAMTQGVIRSKDAWKQALNGWQMHGEGSATEVAALGQKFETERKAYAQTVHKLALGGAGMPAQNVAHYLEVSAALSELPTRHPVSVRALQFADSQQAATKPAYRAEAARSASPRN